MAWRTVQRAAVAALARRLPEPRPTAVIGTNETRARSVRELVEEAPPHRRVWRRNVPWMTSLVDGEVQS